MGAKNVARKAAHFLLGARTIKLMRFDALRLKARLRRMGRHDLKPSSCQLHLGSGGIHVPGWLNVDVIGSDYDIDFITRLPWKSRSFSVIVSQHVIEHLELIDELLPLFSELKRVLRPGGQIWLS